MKKQIKSIILLFVFLIGIISLCSCEAKKSKEKSSESTSKQTVYNSTTEQSSTEAEKESTTEDENAWKTMDIDIPKIDNSEYSDLTYDDLLDQLDDIMEKKEYGDFEYSYIKPLFDHLYDNYNDWRSIQKGWPSREYFISCYLLKPLNDCELHFVEKNRDKDEWEMLEAQGSAQAFTTENFRVTVMCDQEIENEYPNLYDAMLADILHELGHVTQKEVVFKDNALRNYTFLKEGWPTVLMDVANVPKTRKQSSNALPLSNDEIEIHYENDDGDGYPIDGKFTNQLVYLAGFETLEAVMQGEPVGIIFRKIADRYGFERAEKIRDLLKTIELINLTEYDELIEKHLDECNRLVDLENEFLDCIKQDISELNTRQEVEEYTSIYRGYMIDLLPRVYKNLFTDVTDDYFPKAKELNKEMAEKIHSTGAFGLEKLSSAEALVSSTSIESFSEYAFEYYPTCLTQTKYLETSDGLYLFYHYKDDADWEEKTMGILIKSDIDEVQRVYYEPDGMKPFYS